MGCNDGTFHSGQALYEWSNLLVSGSKNLGRPLAAASHHRDRMVAAGFTNVTVKHFKWPTNRWPKDKKHKLVGLWTLANLGTSLEGLSMALLTRGHGWTRDQVVSYVSEVRKDLQDGKIHAYWPM